MPTLDRAREIVERFAGTRIVVVGDAMLDQFIVGRVNRISPEAPVPVVEFDHDEFRLGGAANVAHNVRTLGGDARLVACVGDDAAGHTLAKELNAIGVGAEGLMIDRHRPTTRKTRIVTTRNQQVARVDYEIDVEIAGDPEEALIDRLARAADAAQAILISDYLKGVVTRTVVERAVAVGRARGIPVLVDPKIPHLDYYTGASLVTPNHHEAEIATHRRIRTSQDAREAARVFRHRVGCESVLITRGEHGMWLLDAGLGDGEPGRWLEMELPAASREVADVTGAGDTVIATMALALAAGARLAEAAELANHAAGVSVSRFGPATVTPDELLRAASQADAR